MVNNMMQVSYAAVSFILSSFVQTSVEHLGWKETIALGGALSFNLVPIGWWADSCFQMVSRRKNSNKKVEEDKINNDAADQKSFFLENVKSAFEIGLLLDPCFVSYCISSACLNSVRILAPMFLVRSAQDAGINDQDAAALLKYYFLAMFPCCFFMGVATNVVNNPKSKSG